MPMPTLEIMFWKRALHKYVHTYTHIYISEKLFTKIEWLNLAFALQAHFLEWHLMRFGKELFIYTYINMKSFFSKTRYVPFPQNGASNAKVKFVDCALGKSPS